MTHTHIMAHLLRTNLTRIAIDLTINHLDQVILHITTTGVTINRMHQIPITIIGQILKLKDTNMDMLHVGPIKVSNSTIRNRVVLTITVVVVMDTTVGPVIIKEGGPLVEIRVVVEGHHDLNMAEATSFQH